MKEVDHRERGRQNVRSDVEKKSLIIERDPFYPQKLATDTTNYSHDLCVDPNGQVLRPSEMLKKAQRFHGWRT